MPTPWLAGLWTPGAHLRLVTLSSDHFPAEGSVPGRPRDSLGQRPKEAWMGGRSVSAQLPAGPGRALRALRTRLCPGTHTAQATEKTGQLDLSRLENLRPSKDTQNPRSRGREASGCPGQATGPAARGLHHTAAGRSEAPPATWRALRGERSWAPETTCRRGRTVWKSLRTGRRAGGCPRSGGPGSADRKREGRRRLPDAPVPGPPDPPAHPES